MPKANFPKLTNQLEAANKELTQAFVDWQVARREGIGDLLYDDLANNLAILEDHISRLRANHWRLQQALDEYTDSSQDKIDIEEKPHA